MWKTINAYLEIFYLGHGESILKYCLAHSIIKLMESGNDANTATKMAVDGKYFLYSLTNI